VETAAITNLRWTPDGQALSYLSPQRGTQGLWRVPREGGPPDQVFRHEPGRRFADTLALPDTAQADVELYEWSPDGAQIAFTTRPLPDSTAVRRLTDGGVLYDDTRMWMLDIIHRQWLREPAQLWIYDARTHRETHAWQAPPAAAQISPGIWDLAWSPDSRNIALTYAAGTSVATGLPNYDLGVLEVRTGKLNIVVATDSMYEGAPAWSPDGTRLAFTTQLETLLNTLGSRSALGIVRVPTGEVRYLARGKMGPPLIRELWWLPGGSAIAFEAANPGAERRERSGLYAVDVASDTVRRLTPTEDHVSDCGPIIHERIACVRQNPNVPPDPVVVDLATGQSQAVATANPEAAEMIRGEVTELRWANKFGAETNGYLIRPFNYIAGHRYPLVLILYGFQGRFVGVAEQITNYPAQLFARRGFAVVLWNYPRRNGPMRGNESSVLSSLEEVIRLLAGQRLVDTSRVGIMGVSLGGYWTELALARSSLFRAGSVANTALFHVGAQWLLGSRAYRELYNMAPSDSQPPNADRLRTPVLLEYSADEAPFGLEMLSMLRRAGTPVEFRIYPDDGHVLSQPRHRLASMRRNLEWFSFWLLGREEPGPDRRGQYARWRRMKDRLTRDGA
jgi:dipeptidyl aminopeptidase/acylaminoacyl peptidase